MKIRILALAAALLLFAAGCRKNEEVKRTEEETDVKTYTQITQEEAKDRMALQDGHLIVDVRRPDEYAEGHIPGAICVPNETIEEEAAQKLPDKDQVLLVYCRSGRRSKEAAQKLADMGYTNVYEFGGIIDWTGEITTDAPEMILRIGETQVPVIWENNPSVEALKELLPLSIEMSMYGGFEQVGFIGQEIVSDDEQTKTEPGDIVLYSGDQIVIFYGNNSWAYTRLGHISLDKEKMADLLSHGEVVISITAGTEKQK